MIKSRPKNIITLLSALVVLGFIAFVSYGLYTTCDDAAIYIYCENSER